MLRYLIIQLDDTSVSYCCYENKRNQHKLISEDDLRAGIMFAMKENLQIQFVYPDYALPQSYLKIIETIDHSNIVSSKGVVEKSDVVVFDGWSRLSSYIFNQKDVACVLRTTREEFFVNYIRLVEVLRRVTRLNVIFTDIETFKEVDFEIYKKCLINLANNIKELYLSKETPQLNLVTDRMLLNKMNNCNAGWESVTLAPNGQFYVCPAFYLNDEFDSVGNLKDGLDIKNPQLFRLNNSPLCSNCDAYQCKRCIWLNCKMTLEVNIPSREQCIMAHLERNAARNLLQDMRKYGDFLPGVEIKEISYLDLFDVRQEC